ncbi:hypothetical protein PLCT2_01902 [Planctomycetaceae bacterium]|nr:hypothetical protein PLCT2_01902 [Planctomycetaceae bacterium]
MTVPGWGRQLANTRLPFRVYHYVSVSFALRVCEEKGGAGLTLLSTTKFEDLREPEAEDFTTSMDAIFPISFAGIDKIERARNGRNPHLSLQAQSSYREAQLEGEAVPLKWIDWPSDSGSSQTVQFSLSRDHWAEQLTSANIADVVSLEIPVLESLKPAFSSVYKAIVEAKTEFKKGGEQAWADVVKHIRHADEKWQDLRPLGQIGPQNDLLQKPKHVDDWSKEDRLRLLQWALRQFTNFAPHSHSENWNGDDALLSLAAFSALLRSVDR